MKGAADHFLIPEREHGEVWEIGVDWGAIGG